MYALNTVTGRLVWSFRSSQPIRTTAILSGTATKTPYIYFGSGDRSIYMLNAKTGERIDSYFTEGMVSSSPAVKEFRGNTTLFVGSDDGNLYAFSTTPC
jgi:outer membrane protein assembly factor BamB